MLRFGPREGPVIVAVLPLFEEANRTRAALVDVLRRLAVRGIGGALPELPGAGESLIPTEQVTLADWREAFAAAVRAIAAPVHVMAWRGGALVDAATEARARWYLSPTSGAQTVRELRRMQAAAQGPLFAGNRLSQAMLLSLEGAEPTISPPPRVVRLDTDPRPADGKLPGRPLWRAAEPGVDIALQQAIADDIAMWVAQCGG